MFYNVDRFIDRGEDLPLSGVRISTGATNPEVSKRLKLLVDKMAVDFAKVDRWQSPAAKFFGAILPGHRCQMLGPEMARNTFVFIVETDTWPRRIEISFQESVCIAGGYYFGNLAKRIRHIVYGDVWWAASLINFASDRCAAFVFPPRVACAPSSSMCSTAPAMTTAHGARCSAALCSHTGSGRSPTASATRTLPRPMAHRWMPATGIASRLAVRRLTGVPTTVTSPELACNYGYPISSYRMPTRAQWDTSVKNQNAKGRLHQLVGCPVDRITREQWDEVREVFNDQCAYCLAPADTIEHIEPFALFGRNIIENMVPACKGCNFSKRHDSLLQWVLKVGV